MIFMFKHSWLYVCLEATLFKEDIYTWKSFVILYKADNFC